MFRENLKMAFLSLRGAKLRSFLTMLGIIIGVASVTSVVAIGNGVKAAVTDQVTSLGTNILQVNPGQAFADEGEHGSGGGFNPASAFGASTLSEKDVQTIQSLPRVESAAPVMLVSGTVLNGTKRASNAILIATTPDLAKAIKVEFSQGKFLDTNSGNIVVLGYAAAEALFGENPDALGKTVQIRGQDFKVVGVTKKPETEGFLGGSGLESGVIIPFDTGKAFNNGVGNINEIDLKVRGEASDVQEVKAEIKELLKQNHGGETDFTVLDQAEQLKIFDTILGLLTTFVAAIAAISLLVGGIGIMNIMLVSVTERTREIGIRKAIGATRRAILTQFLIEALTLTLLGGLLGIALAFGQGLLTERLAGIKPVFDPLTLALAFGISAAIGIIFGIAPAIKAARKRPIDALRYE